MLVFKLADGRRRSLLLAPRQRRTGDLAAAAVPPGGARLGGTAHPQPAAGTSGDPELADGGEVDAMVEYPVAIAPDLG